MTKESQFNHHTSYQGAYVAQKGDTEQYEYKSKDIRVNKSYATHAKKNSRGLKKDQIMDSLAQRSLTKGN